MKYPKYYEQIQRIKMAFCSLEPALSSRATNPFQAYWFYWQLKPLYPVMLEICNCGNDTEKESVLPYLNKFSEIQSPFLN